MGFHAGCMKQRVSSIDVDCLVQGPIKKESMLCSWRVGLACEKWALRFKLIVFCAVGTAHLFDNYSGGPWEHWLASLFAVLKFWPAHGSGVVAIKCFCLS